MVGTGRSWKATVKRMPLRKVYRVYESKLVVTVAFFRLRFMSSLSLRRVMTVQQEFVVGKETRCRKQFDIGLANPFPYPPYPFPFPPLSPL